VDHTNIGDVPLAIGHERARPSQILDRFVEESWRSIYAGQLEMRPPGAPTIEHEFVGLRRSTQLLVNTLRVSVVLARFLHLLSCRFDSTSSLRRYSSELISSSLTLPVPICSCVKETQ